MARLIALLLAFSIAAPIVAQDAAQAARENATDEASDETDLTRPPRISAGTAPGSASLEPAEEEREDMLEAVVTGGQTDYRLPDLGTSLRAENERRDPNQRYDVTFLNLYDPDNIDPAEEAFPSLEEKIGVGMLRVFELRFRAREREPE